MKIVKVEVSDGRSGIYGTESWSSSEIHDQQYLNLKLESEMERLLVYKTLPLAQFPTGNIWFSNRAEPSTTMIHSNYFKGVKAKI